MVLTRKHKVIMIVMACTLFLGIGLYDRIMSSKNVYVLSDTNPPSSVEPLQTSIDVGNQTDMVKKTHVTEETEVETPAIIIVHIEGEVLLPGVYELNEGARVNDLVEMAGGLTPEADRRINLAQKLQDEVFVYVPSMDEDNREDNHELIPSSHNIAFQPTGSAQTSSLVNINTADQKSLETLTGIGPVLAERIIVYREEKGPFQQLQDLKKVTGIGDKRYQDIENDITL